MSFWEFIHAHADGLGWMIMITVLLIFIDRVASKISGLWYEKK
jgi:hypothetical protein